MKNVTPLTKLVVVALFVLLIPTDDVSAQSTSDRQAVKEWITANKNNVTLVSSKEFQSMSPAVKAVIEADPKSIVYTETVKIEDIQKFEGKTSMPNYVPFQDESTKANLQEKAISKEKKEAALFVTHEERVEVKNWIENAGRGVKIISEADYMAMPQNQRVLVGTTNVLIYAGKELRMKDIQGFKYQD